MVVNRPVEPPRVNANTLMQTHAAVFAFELAVRSIALAPPRHRTAPVPSLTPRLGSICLSPPGCMVATGSQSAGNLCPHVSVVCLCSGLFQKEASSSPDLCPAPPSLSAQEVSSPNSTFSVCRLSTSVLRSSMS